MVMGLTTGLWVSAQVRLCDLAFIPAIPGVDLSSELEPYKRQ